MNTLLHNLYYGESSEFLLKRTAFSNYLIVYSISRDGNCEEVWKSKAESLIARAVAKEPMDFDIEAEKLFMEILYAKT